MTDLPEPTEPNLADVPGENRYEIVFYAEGVVDRSNETTDEGEPR